MGSLISVQLSQVKIQKFFVGNVGDNLNDEALRTLFESYGKSDYMLSTPPAILVTFTN